MSFSPMPFGGMRSFIEDRRSRCDDCGCGGCCGMSSCRLLDGVVLESNCVVVMVVVVEGIEVTVDSLGG